MTLIELLVVVIILTTIVAAAIPIMAPSNDDRRLREATRGLNTFITGAQARAIATGRPYGIALKRLSADTERSAPINASNTDNDNGVCLEVFYVEEQPPYSGFSRSSCVCVSINPNTGLVTIRFVTRGNTYPPSQDGLPPGWDADLFPPNTIRVGDVIEIGDTRYVLTGNIDQQVRNTQPLIPDKNGFLNPPAGRGQTPGQPGRFPPSLSGQPINDTGQQINPVHDSNGNEIAGGNPSGGIPPGSNPAPPYWTAPMPYKILRQGTITSDEPYQLPEGTAIDLRASGVGSDDYFFVPGITDNSHNVVIMFAPEGRVSRVSFSLLPPPPGNEPANYDESVVDNLYLLVGKRENIPAPLIGNDPTLNSSDLAAATTDEQRQELKEPINWLRGNSRWVVIGSQSGRVVTVENAFVDPQSVFTFATSQTPPVAQSSEELRNQQILAAREFTREMNQLGGR